jgi:hypothetical protein
MLRESHRLFVWISRGAGVALVLFVALFALDAFDGSPLREAIPAFLIHLLPAAVVAAVVAAAWRWPWLGAAGFAALAIVYAVSVQTRWDWIAAIGGPLLVVAMLFALSAVSTPRSSSASRA